MSQAKIKLLRKRLRKFKAEHAQRIRPVRTCINFNANDAPKPTAQPAEPLPLPSPGGRGETISEPPVVGTPVLQPPPKFEEPKPVKLRRCRYCRKTDPTKPGLVVCHPCAKRLHEKMFREMRERGQMRARMRELATWLYPRLRKYLGRPAAPRDLLSPAASLYRTYSIYRIIARADDDRVRWFHGLIRSMS